jgi:hypothetical protein
VPESVELLAVDLGELDSVAGVVDLEVEDGPDEREAALLARDLPITFVLRFTSPSVRSSGLVERQRLRWRSG